MAFEEISLGLTITIPTNGTDNWGTTVKNLTWNIISQHRHTGSGDGLQMIESSISDDQVSITKLKKNIGRFQQSTLTPAGTTQTIDWDNGSKVILDLGSASGDVTLTLNNPITGGDYRIKVIEGVTPRKIVWPASVKFPGGVEPSQVFLASSDNIVYLDFDGSVYLAKWDCSFS